MRRVSGTEVWETQCCGRAQLCVTWKFKLRWQVWQLSMSGIMIDLWCWLLLITVLGYRCDHWKIKPFLYCWFAQVPIAFCFLTQLIGWWLLNLKNSMCCSLGVYHLKSPLPDNALVWYLSSCCFKRAFTVTRTVSVEVLQRVIILQQFSCNCCCR